MHDSVLRKLDLNLLVALDVLLSVDNFSAAAEVLGVKQAALRHTLRRLREVFDDALLEVSEQGDLIKTAKAQVLAEPLDKALVELRQVLGTCVTFQPARSRHHFVVASDEFTSMLLLPALLRSVAELAPRVTLEVLPACSVASAAALQAGKLDLLLQHGCKPAVTTSQQPLFTDALACASRRGHPGIEGQLDRDTYYGLAHVDVLAAGALYQRGGLAGVAALDEREVGLKLPNLNLVPEALINTELLLTAPRRCLDAWAEQVPLDIFPAPIALPTYSPRMAWPKRSEHHPAHRWLRRMMSDIAKTLHDD